MGNHQNSLLTRYSPLFNALSSFSLTFSSHPKKKPLLNDPSYTNFSMHCISIALFTNFCQQEHRGEWSKVSTKDEIELIRFSWYTESISTYAFFRKPFLARKSVHWYSPWYLQYSNEFSHSVFIWYWSISRKSIHKK